MSKKKADKIKENKRNKQELNEKHSTNISLSLSLISFLFYCHSIYSLNGIYILWTSLLFVSTICLRLLKSSIWIKFISSISLMYLGFLLILFMQPNISKMRRLMTLFDKNLNREIPLPPSHAFDCHDLYQLNIDSILSKFDQYALSHFMGWVVFTILIRNPCLVWMMAVFWELIESFCSSLSNHRYLTQFEECWYDSLLFDTFGCNLIGMQVGMLIIKLFDLQQYEWSLLFNLDINKIYNKISNIAQPLSLKSEPFTDIKNYFLAIIGVLFMGTIIQYNAFLLKSYLFIPTQHWLNVTRLLFHALTGSVAWNVFYRGMIKKECNVNTTQCFLQVAIIAMECVIIAKFMIHDTEMAIIDVILPWMYASIILAIVSLFLCIK